MYCGHFSLFHIGMSLLHWCKCSTWEIYVFIRVKSMNMFCLHLQSGVPRHFLKIYCSLNLEPQAPLTPSNWSTLYRRSRLASHELNTCTNQALKSAHPSLLSSRCWPWGVLVLVSRYSTVRSGTLTWREWGLCLEPAVLFVYINAQNSSGNMQKHRHLWWFEGSGGQGKYIWVLSYYKWH